MLQWRTSSRKVVLLATLLAVVLSNLVGVGKAFARDNKGPVRDAASAGGWHLITIYELDHAAYLKLIALIATPGGLAQDLLEEYATIYETLSEIAVYASVAEVILDVLIESLQTSTGTDKIIELGPGTAPEANLRPIQVVVKLLTYQHWHNEKFLVCDYSGIYTTCDWDWVKVPEPNTHELVLMVRQKPSDPPSGSSPIEPDVACDGTIFVDAAYTGTQHGTAAKPFRTVGAAYAYACNGAALQIRGGTYAEQWTFDKQINVRFTAASETGTVSIGQGAMGEVAAAAQADTFSVVAAPESSSFNTAEVTTPTVSGSENAITAIYLPLVANMVATQTAEPVTVSEEVTPAVAKMTTDEVYPAGQRIFLPLINQQ